MKLSFFLTQSDWKEFKSTWQMQLCSEDNNFDNTHIQEF